MKIGNYKPEYPSGRRGWNRASEAKPASEYTFRSGSGVLLHETTGPDRALVVTTPAAYQTAHPFFGEEPAAVAFVERMDFAELRKLSDALPDDADKVIGLGGGRALDASKLVAVDKDLPLVLAPTIASSGAIIHGMVGTWEGRSLVGTVDDWPWADCEYVLIDHDVLLQAPEHLHTAGLGDILCEYAGTAEWRWRAGNGMGPPLDGGCIESVNNYHDKLTENFVATLDSGGNLTADSVGRILSDLRDRDSRSLRHPAAKSGDHPFWMALELLHDRSWIHGEIVALGALIIAWHANAQPEILIDRLDRCKVRWRPSKMDLSRDQLRDGLAFTPEYMQAREIDSILRHQPVVEARFDSLWEYLEG